MSEPIPLTVFFTQFHQIFINFFRRFFRFVMFGVRYDVFRWIRSNGCWNQTTTIDQTLYFGCCMNCVESVEFEICVCVQSVTLISVIGVWKQNFNYIKLAWRVNQFSSFGTIERCLKRKNWTKFRWIFSKSFRISNYDGTGWQQLKSRNHRELGKPNIKLRAPNVH